MTGCGMTSGTCSIHNPCSGRGRGVAKKSTRYSETVVWPELVLVLLEEHAVVDCLYPISQAVNDSQLLLGHRRRAAPQ